MGTTARVSAGTLAPLFAEAERAGVPRETLLAATRLTEDALSPGSKQVPYDRVTALWREAARRSKDEAFGLHAAEHLAPGSFDVAEYAALNHATLGEALLGLCRYQALLTEVARFSLEGARLRLTFQLGPGAAAPSRHAREYLLACVLQRLRQAAGAQLSPARVELRHAEPPRASEQRRFFGCPVRFDAGGDALVFHPATLEAPLRGADPKLRAILDRHARALLDALPSTETFAARVRTWLGDHLLDGATLAAAAAHLGSSERVLQRQLRAEGSSFEALLADARRAEAIRLLDEPRVTLADIAYRLGFSEPSAFHRAFKRWTGQTPLAYRQRPRL